MASGPGPQPPTASVELHGGRCGNEAEPSNCRIAEEWPNKVVRSCGWAMATADLEARHALETKIKGQLADLEHQQFPPGAEPPMGIRERGQMRCQALDVKAFWPITNEMSRAFDALQMRCRGLLAHYK